VEIRALGEADADAYRSIRLRALRDEPEAFGTSYDEAKARPFSYYSERLRGNSEGDSFTLGAYSNGELVGLVSWHRGQASKERHKGYITAMDVVPECRGQGTGRALLEGVSRRAEALPGVEQILLTVVSGNLPARRLYESLGFSTYGTERRTLKLADRYLDEELMVLPLREETPGRP
jgi:ribosomal protein S18 acetylase RimI-like enzyme